MQKSETSGILSICPFSPLIGGDFALITAWSQGKCKSKLHPDEQLIANQITHEARRKHFVDGRKVAHTALERLNFKKEVPIGKGESGAPIWPEGFVGSISHSGQAVAALVGRAESYLSSAVDIQVRKEIDVDRFLKRIANDGERKWVTSQSAVVLCCFLLFSAKEACYKLLSSLAKEPLGFTSVECDFSEYEKGTIHVRVKKDLSSQIKEGFSFDIAFRIEGMYVCVHGLLPTQA